MRYDRLLNQLRRTETLFKDKSVLLQDDCTGEPLFRDRQQEELIYHLCPDLPNNVATWGKPGTGKSLIIKILGELWERNTPRSKFVYVNCKWANTDYRVYYHILGAYARNIAVTGFPVDYLRSEIVKALDQRKHTSLIVLDEIDGLIRKPHNYANPTLYTLSRLNTELKRSKMAVWIVSNDLNFTDYLDPRALSSLALEDVYFPPYTSGETFEIIRTIAERALKSGTYSDDALRLISEHIGEYSGDVRMAKKVLKKAAEMTWRDGCSYIDRARVQKAYEEVQRDIMVQAVETLPVQTKIVLLTCIQMRLDEEKQVSTGEIYTAYKSITKHYGTHTLTIRRVTELVAELDGLNLIYAKISSLGRFGRSRYVKNVHPTVVAYQSALESQVLKEL